MFTPIPPITIDAISKLIALAYAECQQSQGKKVNCDDYTTHQETQLDSQEAVVQARTPKARLELRKERSHENASC